MPLRRFVVIGIEPPSVVRYLIGAAIMMLGVVLPVGYMMFRNKRVPSSSSTPSSYSKQTDHLKLNKCIRQPSQGTVGRDSMANDINEQGFDIEFSGGPILDA
ncbi:hypothetical protein OROGR_005544 [Orobanche gracilis]